MKNRPYLFELKLTDDQLEQLASLAETPAIGNTSTKTRDDPEAAQTRVLQYLVERVCDGVRRPSSWERQVVQQVFGFGTAFYFTDPTERADEATDAGDEGRLQ